MKNFAIKLVWSATFIVFLTTVLTQSSVDRQIFLVLIIALPLLLMYMVYRVLKDNYRAGKTFEHFYEDYPKRDGN